MPSLRWNLAVALALIAAVLPAGEASANVAAPTEDPGRLTAPRYAVKSPLVVRDERLSFQCQEEEGRPGLAYGEGLALIERHAGGARRSITTTS
jgi:hypothetical protein